jgi:hypothetical protein
MDAKSAHYKKDSDTCPPHPTGIKEKKLKQVLKRNSPQQHVCDKAKRIEKADTKGSGEIPRTVAQEY